MAYGSSQLLPAFLFLVDANFGKIGLGSLLKRLKLSLESFVFLLESLLLPPESEDFLDQLFFRLLCQKDGLGLKRGSEGHLILHFGLRGGKNSVGVNSYPLRDYGKLG